MYIYILHDGSLVIYFSKRSQIDSRLSRFNFSSGAPVCLVRFGEENGEIIDVYMSNLPRISKMIKKMKKMTILAMVGINVFI